MAVKFKSKYTAQQIEQLLDGIDASSKGAFVQVDELPDATDANTSMFYLCDGKIYYIDTTTKDWAEIQTGGGNNDSDSDNVISTDEFEFNQLNYADFKPTTKLIFQPLQVGDKMPVVFTYNMIQNPEVKSSIYYIGKQIGSGFDGVFYYDKSNEHSLIGWCGDVINMTGDADTNTNTVTLDTEKHPDLLSTIIIDIEQGDGDIGYMSTSAIDYFKVENNVTAVFLEELISTMETKGVNYYQLTGVKGEGWIDGFDDNNIVQVQASFAQDTDEEYVFIVLTLINGTQVRLSRDKEDHSLWTIGYIGYAL